MSDPAYDALAARLRFQAWLIGLPWHVRLFAPWRPLWRAYHREAA